MKKKNIFIAFILIGIVASFILAFNRVSVETNNKSVDLILDYDSMKELSKQSNKDLSWWLKKFKGFGISSVSLTEESFESMVKEELPLKVEIVETFKKGPGLRDKYSEELTNYLEQDKVDRYDLVVVTDSKEHYDFIKRGLDERYDSKNYKAIESEGEYSFILDGTIKEALYSKIEVIVDSDGEAFSQENKLVGSSLMKLGLGYDEEKIKTIKEAGLDVILRPLTYSTDWTEEKYVKASLNQYKKLDIKPNYMIFTGKEILGYPDNLDLVEDFIKEEDVKIALIESAVQRQHLEQEGLDELTEQLDYEAIRLFSVPGYVQERYKYNNYKGAEEIENTLYRAVTERNIRAVYFHPFKLDKERYVTDYREYEKTFASFEERIEKHNMTIGDASVMKSNHINIILKMLLGLGILGGAMLLLEELLRITDRFSKFLIGLGILGIIVSSIVVPNFSNIVFAIASAVIFPSLSMVYFCKKFKTYYNDKTVDKTLKNTIVTGIKELLTMTLISAIGALFVSAVLSDIKFLLEIDIFRGVKLAQIVPILVYIIAFIGYFGYKKDKDLSDNKINTSDIKSLFLDNIKIVSAIVVGIVGYIGYIYLARTGHETNVQPSTLEIMARNLLELKLIARPRIKEFLLAFPAVIMAVDFIFGRKKLAVFIIGLFIALGQTSVVNTFSHLRTPIYLSATRLTYGIIAGIIVGIVYLLIMKSGIKILKFLRGEILHE